MGGRDDGGGRATRAEVCLSRSLPLPVPRRDLGGLTLGDGAGRKLEVTGHVFRDPELVPAPSVYCVSTAPRHLALSD